MQEAKPHAYSVKHARTPVLCHHVNCDGVVALQLKRLAEADAVESHEENGNSKDGNVDGENSGRFVLIDAAPRTVVPARAHANKDMEAPHAHT